MQGNEFIWLGSIIFGLTVMGWLALDWFEHSQQWEEYDSDSIAGSLNSAQGPRDLDLETELLLCYPMDPFAPALLWRPTSGDEWIEGQENGRTLADQSPNYFPVQTG